MEERLVQALARESKLSAECESQANELATLREQVATMKDHPDVRRAERERLLAQAAELVARAESLAPPKPKGESEGAPESEEEKALPEDASSPNPIHDERGAD